MLLLLLPISLHATPATPATPGAYYSLALSRTICQPGQAPQPAAPFGALPRPQPGQRTKALPPTAHAKQVGKPTPGKRANQPPLAGRKPAKKTAAPMYGSFGFDTAGMDRRVKPGDDFYAYVNGTWQRKAEIPASQAFYAPYSKLQELSVARTRRILEDAEKQAGSQMGDFYASFLDEAAADRKGVAPLQPWLAQIAAAQDKSALAASVAAFQRQGVEALFSLSGLVQAVRPDDKAPQVEVFHINQGGLGLPDRDYYLKNDTALVQARHAYVVYLTQLLQLAGQENAAPRA